MKKTLLTAACALFAAFSAQAVTVLEYNIGSVGNVNQLPINPNAGGTLSAEPLSFIGTPAGIDFPGQAVTTGWQVAADAASVNAASGQWYVFTAAAFDYTGATLKFGASSQRDGNIAVFANGNLVGSQAVAGGTGANLAFDLTSLGAQSDVQFQLIGWGTTDPGFLGLDTDFGGATENVIIDAPTTPIPEPHEYAMLAGFGLVGFAIYRRRQMAQAETQA